MIQNSSAIGDRNTIVINRILTHIIRLLMSLQEVYLPVYYSAFRYSPKDLPIEENNMETQKEVPMIIFPETAI